MAIKIIATNAQIERDGSTSIDQTFDVSLGDISLTIEPIFEYIANQFFDFSENKSELEMPNCYLETVFDVENAHPELDGLVFFKGNSLPTEGAFDRRRYFTNFYYHENDGKINTLSGSARFQNIVLTNYSSLGGNIGKNTFYNDGYGLGKLFPSKINLSISNLGRDTETLDTLRKFLNRNNYKYHFLHDIVQGAVGNDTRNVLINDVLTTVKYYNILKDYSLIDLNSSNHTALIKDNEPDVDKQAYYTNLLNKAEQYNKEVVFVRIQKTYGDQVQNFWIYPNSEGNLKYSDCQVKVEKDYTYQAFLYLLITDESVPIGPDDNNEEIILYEIPLEGPVVTKIMQPPHPRPQVEFKNVKYKKDQIRISMNLSSNEYKSLTYKGVSESEEQVFFDNYVKYDPNNLRDSYYQYETEPGKYQIYKMKRQPTSYYDIGTNAELMEAESPNSTLLTITDNISPFVDYYYMIRSYNSYGYYSNPSPIYKVHMTKDATETFLNIETVDFFVSDQNKYMLEKTMAKLLQVVPSSYQTTLKVEESFDGYSGITNPNDLPQLGLVPEKIWDTNTKFKLRLVSKKTGKKIDINLNFKLTKQIT